MYRIPSLVYNTVRSVLFVSSSKQILGCLRGLHSQVFAVRIWSSSSHTTKLAQISYRYWLIFNQRNSTVAGAGIEPATPSTVVCWIYHCATASQFVFFQMVYDFFFTFNFQDWTVARQATNVNDTSKSSTRKLITMLVSFFYLQGLLNFM